jgi:predicted RecB family nuclease
MDTGTIGKDVALPLSDAQQCDVRGPGQGRRMLQPYLTKSRYTAGLQCEKRLWLSWHAPEPRSEPDPGTPMAVGTEVGEAARLLFPDGVLVSESSRDLAAAEARTRALVAAGAPVIFEAAFRGDGIVIRADILERLPDGQWSLAEVKSATSYKPEYLGDLAIQVFALRRAGLPLRDVSLIHVNRDYVRGEGPVDWQHFFRRVDLTAAIEAELVALPAKIARLQAVLEQAESPTIAPGPHCFVPHECEFWSRCTSAKPDDWVFHLRGLRTEKFAALAAAGIERIGEIPDEFPLSDRQRLLVACALSGEELVAPGLADELRSFARPAWYMDFETGNPAIPLYLGTRPYQRIPFQWSLHHDDGAGGLRHFEFLADCRTDPRRAFAETLLEAVASDGPVIVYSAFENAVLQELAASFPDLADAITELRERLRDLLPVVRRSIVHPAMLGSYSIKAVAPALVPGFTYNLEGVSDGGAASAAFYRLASGRFLIGETAEALRAGLRSYCERDTLALVGAHCALREKAVATMDVSGELAAST